MRSGDAARSSFDRRQATAAGCPLVASILSCHPQARDTPAARPRSLERRLLGGRGLLLVDRRRHGQRLSQDGRRRGSAALRIRRTSRQPLQGLEKRQAHLGRAGRIGRRRGR